MATLEMVRNRILLGSIALEPNRWTDGKIPWNDLSTIVDAAATRGFQHIEVWEFHVNRLSDRELAEQRDAAAEAGISFPVLAMYPNFLSPSDANEVYFNDIVRRARLLGVEKLKTFTGNKASASLALRERNHSIAQLNMLANIAEVEGITISAELHQNSLSDTADEALRTLSEVNCELNICFQPIDFTDTDSTITDFTRLSKYVDHIHLQGRRDGSFVQLSDADINYNAFFDVLGEADYQGDFCIEFVKDCIVEDADSFNTRLVADNAATDRDFLAANLAR